MLRSMASPRAALGLSLFLATTAGLAACAAWQWQPIGSRRTQEVAGAEPVGAEECLVCHEVIQGRPKIAAYHSGCESCHGAGSLHAASERIEEVRFPDNGDCLGCHAAGRSTHLEWGTGEHSRAGLLCSDCHNPHLPSRRHLRAFRQSGFARMDATSRLCVECHRDVAAQLNLPSHHPVREGALACISCHDPHEDRSVAFGDRNQLCADCHQDTMGPWLFEHPPVVEACATCHDPHGAVSQNLLATIQPAICLSCHSLNDTWHHEPLGTGIASRTTISGDRPSTESEQVTSQQARLYLRRCTDCHGAIHGSYTDEHLRH